MTRVPNRKASLARPGINRDVLADKLTERWLFGRCVVELYELAIEQLDGRPDARAIATWLPEMLGQERLHVELLEALLGQLGRVPREEPATPAVNIAASEAEVLVEALRPSPEAPPLATERVLEVLHAAELLDLASWELLTELGAAADLDEDWLRSFRAATREEREHQHLLRTWLGEREQEVLLAAAPAT